MEAFFEFINTEDNIKVIKEKMAQFEEGSKASKYVPIYIDCKDLVEKCCHFFEQPLESINANLYSSLFEACEKVLQANDINVDLFVVPRVKNLEIVNQLISNNNSISSKHVNRIVRLTGIVTHVDRLRVFARHTVYCCKKCRHKVKIKIKSVFELCNHPAPALCQHQDCGHTVFDVISSSKTNYIDYQEICVRLDENSCKHSNSQLPTIVNVILQYEQVDKCQPGEHVVFYGLVKCRLPILVSKVKCFTDIVVIANHFELLNNLSVSVNSVNNFSFLSLKEIVGSFASNLYGMHFLKLATVVTVNSINVCGNNSDRHNCHLLVSGSSGCGKTQLFNAALKLVPNSVFVIGTNTTKAGLTASVVRDSAGFFTVEPGALPLSDEGLCVIDEFDRLAADDLNAIHEAMEQQTITVSKAGVISRLRCKNTLLCCKSNSKKKLPTPLFSRFDLVFVITDKFDEEKEINLCRHIFKQKNNDKNEQKIKNYLHQISKQKNGAVSQTASNMIKNYYNEKVNEKNEKDSLLYSSRTTTRLIESLVRLSLSISKLQGKTFVDDNDAALAILLMQVSFGTLSFKCEKHLLALLDSHDLDAFFADLHNNLQTIKQNYAPLNNQTYEELLTLPEMNTNLNFSGDLSDLNSLCNSDID